MENEGQEEVSGISSNTIQTAESTNRTTLVQTKTALVVQSTTFQTRFLMPFQTPIPYDIPESIPIEADALGTVRS